MVNCRELIVETGEILKIAKRGIAPAVFHVVNEGRAEAGAEKLGTTADLHRAGRIAGVLDKGFRRRCNFLAAPARIKSNPFAINTGPVFSKDIKNIRGATKIHSDHVEYFISVGFNHINGFVAD